MNNQERSPGTAVTRRYEIERCGERWYVRDKRLGSRHGPYQSRQQAHDVLLEIGRILAHADLCIMRLLGEPLYRH
jgi:hypothetical protein